MKREEICGRIPHAGDMCLLEQVEQWDRDRLVCRAVSHRRPDNPLRHRGRLHAVAGVEYAGQAMALHGGLTDTSGRREPRRGFLASVRELRLERERLDDLDADLRIVVRRLTAAADSSLYEFELSAGGETVLSGRAAVKLL